MHADAEWARSKDDRRSIPSFYVFVSGNQVSWNNMKQNVVSRSSTELEHRAMSHVTTKIMWIFHILNEVGLEALTLAKLFCDNQAVLHVGYNPVFHERTKHIEVDCHFIREKK